MDVLPACMSVHHISAVSTEARSDCQVYWNWVWVLGIEPGSLEEHPVFLAAEPSLQVL